MLSSPLLLKTKSNSSNMHYVTINGNVLKALLTLQAFLMLIPLLIGVK